MKINQFNALRQRIIDAGYGEEITWSESIKPCDNADDFFGEYMWVVLSSGIKNQIARLIQQRIYNAWKLGKQTITAFRHQGKVNAIDYVKRNKDLIFELYQTSNDKIRYLKDLPHIGDITKYHLAKNLGFDIAKPDRHLQRISAKYGLDTLSLCKKLATETGYRVATVDLIIWRAANLGYI